MHNFIVTLISYKGLNAKDNPFIWDNSSSGVKSNCLGLKFEDCHGTPLNVTRLQDPIAITIPRDDIGDSPEPGNFTLTNFGGGFLVAPNPIDFDSALKGFTDIASNPTVFATVITIFGLYFVGAIRPPPT